MSKSKTGRSRLLAVALLLAFPPAAGLTAGAPGASAKPRIEVTCADTGALPCVATPGQSYAGTVVPRSGIDHQPIVEAVLSDVLAGPAQIAPLAVDVTGTADHFELSPPGLGNVQSFGWRYEGSDQRLAYITVKAANAFAIIGIAGTTSGTVDISGLLGGHDISHIGFWAAVMTPVRPVRPSAVHGEGLLGNTRLAKIDDGSVACMHVETAEVRRCPFDEDADDWIESGEGDFAVAGRPTTPDGGPEERYVIASRVDAAGTVPALEPAGHDSSGVPSGTELIGGSIQEHPLAASNSSGLALRNHATLDVCTGTHPHPDGATLVSTPGPGVFCYRGAGAGLNDRNGTERDAFGVYYPGFEYIHAIWSNGYEVPAAKRPATCCWPTRVVSTSPLVWRPVSYHATIANQ